MQPFPLSKRSRDLTTQYPDAAALIDVGRTLDYFEQQGLLRLWVSEGIPYAFRNTPMLYENVRGWLATKLNVHAKNITVVGSARLGYSLAPFPVYGRPFGPHSDLDFAIISEWLFGQLSDVALKWAADYSSGLIRATVAEERFWADNLLRLPANIEVGFIDEWKIPRRDKYPFVQQVANVFWLLTGKLRLTQDAPPVKKTSARVFRDWRSFVDQLHLNLFTLLQSSKPQS